MCISFHFVLVLFLFYFVSLFLCACIYKCLTRNHFIAVCYQYTLTREKKLHQQSKMNIRMVVCVCIKKNKKPTNKQKNRATCFFSYLTTQTDFVRLHSHTYKETHKKEEKKEGGWLPSTANKQEKKR